MPEEGNSELETDSKFTKETYIDSGVSDKFWIKDSKSYEKETLETFIYKDCENERVVLLMGSDCSTEDLMMMDDDVVSDWSSEVFFNIDNVTHSVITTEDPNADQEKRNKLPQQTFKEAEVTKHKEFRDQVVEDMNPYTNELDKDIEENLSIIQHCPETIPYSGSISLRSTSSTASTQSFAFPILSRESFSSPVRMPKPHNKRQLTKPKQWKTKLCWVCSKF